MNITITGNLGAGKTTVRDELKKLGYDTLSGGDIFRKVAEQRGVSVVELNEMVKGDPAIDDEIDGMTSRLGREVDNTVFDFRLGWHFVPDSFKVFLLIDPDVAAERVYGGTARNAEDYQSLADAKDALRKRARIESERFADLYGIDYYDAKNYDLVIESSYATPEQITREIVRCLKCYESGDTERRIELGIPGLYPTKCVEELAEDRLNACRAKERETDSLCVTGDVPIAVKDGYSYLMGGHHRVFAGASVGKVFARVRLESPGADRAWTALDKQALHGFEQMGGFCYRCDTLVPREGFMLEL